MKKEYTVDDLIVPKLKFSDPCPIRIVVDEERKRISLFVGQRDWEWDLESGERLGSGTGLCAPFPECGLPTA